MAHSEPIPNASDRTPPPALRVESLTKRFPGVIANEDVSLTVQQGTFHAVIGENGAGKSTLLNMLYGLYRPDRGSISIQGVDVTRALGSPSAAIRLGVGLVSQHYALIPALSVLENIMLGAEPVRIGGLLSRTKAEARVQDLLRRLGLEEFDLDQRADQVSVAAGQKIEIVKALFRGAKILLLDEPTATLAPQEAAGLFNLLQTLLADGATILFVTHKLREVMAHSTQVTVLRAGRNAGDFITAESTPEQLLAAMIGPRGASDEVNRSDFLLPGSGSDSAVTLPARTASPEPPPERAALLNVTDLSVRGRSSRLAVRGAGLHVSAGEIVGVAGVDGSGQRELAESIVGLRTAETGRIELARPDGAVPVQLDRKSVRERQRLGVAYVPEDRHRTALALDFTVAENYLLGHETDRSWGGGPILNPRRTIERANRMIRDYDVRLGERDSRVAARTLSGGNQQKTVVARALDSRPALLIASQPTRGLDVEAARFIYRTFQAARVRGLAILLFSLDLDEILELSDRIYVMFDGRIAGEMPRPGATAEAVGALMTGAVQGSASSSGEGTGRL